MFERYDADPGELAVSVHCPADSAVMTAPLSTHGPVSLRTTVAPDVELAVMSVLEPAWTTMGEPTDHGEPPCGFTLMPSFGGAGSMLTCWLDEPLILPGALKFTVMVCTPPAVGVHWKFSTPFTVGMDALMPVLLSK